MIVCIDKKCCKKTGCSIFYAKLHSWNRTSWQTPSARNYRLTAVFKNTRQTVVSGNMRLTAIFTKVYCLPAVLKTPGRRYFSETGA